MSSTYLDNRDARDIVAQHLESRKFEAKLFERGGVFFSPGTPIDESCYREIRDCQLVVMLVGGRYGSPSSDSLPGRRYKSITQKEFETARDARVPVIVFVRREVETEFRTWAANAGKDRRSMTFPSVDSPAVFDFLSLIYKQGDTNFIHKYDRPTEIIDILDKQVSGLVSEGLTQISRTKSREPIRVNGLKLFYHRHQRGLSHRQLAEAANVTKEQIHRLERVVLKPLNEHSFKSTTPEVLTRIENALQQNGALAAGKEDDFLAHLVAYYAIYRKKRRKAPRHDHWPLFPAKAVVLDFDGTMTTKRSDDRTTWERLWVAAGYSVNDCADLVRKYVKDGIVTPEDHEAWCADTCRAFRARGLSRNHLRTVAGGIELVPGVVEVLRELHAKGVKLYVVSGSIREIIEEVFGTDYRLFEQVHANDFRFGLDGVIEAIHSTRFDFQGKAQFLRDLLAREALSPLEVIFIGNSHNDVWASKTGVRTLCVNPHFTDPNDKEQWTYVVREMSHFNQVLPYIDHRSSW